MAEEKPTLESERKGYPETTLSSYLEYDEWTHEEAMLIFCDCDPQYTTVAWVDNGTAHGTSTGQNVLENAQLFREWAGMRQVILEIQTPVLEHPALKDLDIPSATQEDWQSRGAMVAGKANRHPVDEIAWKWIHCIQIGFNLAKVHEAFMRKSPEIDRSALEQHNKPIRKPVGWWIDWAKQHEVAVPWLAWAEENDLVPESTKEADFGSVSIDGTEYAVPDPVAKLIQDQAAQLQSAMGLLTVEQKESLKK